LTSTVERDAPPAWRWVPWVAPFAAFMLLLALAQAVVIPQPWESIARVAILVAVIWVASRGNVRTLRVERAIASTALGLAVFALWVAPDVLVPGWRQHWLFQNAITGSLRTSISPAELASPLVMALRVARAALIVPIVEELFWRGWLPRWMIDPSFERVPLGTYTRGAFIITALLFASEHGPYWEVGLLAGLIYNWWMWRTKSLGDLVLAHAVTNGALSAFVIATGRWELWM
jgi:CAAX prenyl protease-like protein